MSQPAGNIIVVTAPSGAGKTTIVRHLLQHFAGELAFSVSATTRKRREGEEEGRDYYYINVSEFKQLIAEGAFLEWQEVYENQFYGTLRSEVERLWALGKQVVFDIDVQGAVNVKAAFPDRTLTVFVKPPSEAVLVERLRKRRTESEESLQRRIAKAKFELTFEGKFDVLLVNDVLAAALRQAENIVGDWLHKAKKARE
jgi:guanylate kinase